MHFVIRSSKGNTEYGIALSIKGFRCNLSYAHSAGRNRYHYEESNL